MTLKHFIERPVLASVISIVIVIAGIIGLATLPIEQYPDIAPPTVMVRASYPGASAETIQKSVIVPLEQAINGVENMTYITSSAAVGSASVTVYFRQGTDPDMAARERTEQSFPRHRTIALRGNPDRRFDHEAPDLHGKDLLAVQSRRLLRRDVPLQLFENQHRTAYPAYSGRRRSLHARRRLFDARLAETRRDGAVQAHPVGRDGRTVRTEHRVGHGYAGAKTRRTRSSIR